MGKFTTAPQVTAEMPWPPPSERPNVPPTPPNASSRTAGALKPWVRALGRCQTDDIDLAELLSLPGVREECVLRSAVGFMALHGGSQDRGTDQIARRAAERSGASYYAIVQPTGLRVHLTSRLHDPDHSERLQEYLAHVEIAISVHGFGRDGFSLWVDPGRGLLLDPYGPALAAGRPGRCGGSSWEGGTRTSWMPPVDCWTAALPGTTWRTSGYGSVFIPTTRSICLPHTASRSNCHLVSAGSVTSGSNSCPARMASSTRRLLRWSNSRIGPAT